MSLKKKWLQMLVVSTSVLLLAACGGNDRAEGVTRRFTK